MKEKIEAQAILINSNFANNAEIRNFANNVLIYLKNEARETTVKRIKTNEEISIGHLRIKEGVEIYKCTCNNIVNMGHMYCSRCGSKLNFD